MQLSQELRYAGCNDTSEQFLARLVSNLKSVYPDHTVDALVCSPDKALFYCYKVQKDAAAPMLPESVILKALMNFRKNKKLPTGLCTNPTKINYKQELRAAGYPDTLPEFQQLVCDCFASMYKSLTIDHITCFPKEAKSLCSFVRNKTGCPSLEDELILRAIQGRRKNPS